MAAAIQNIRPADFLVGDLAYAAKKCLYIVSVSMIDFLQCQSCRGIACAGVERRVPSVLVADLLLLLQICGSYSCPSHPFGGPAICPCLHDRLRGRVCAADIHAGEVLYSYDSGVQGSNHMKCYFVDARHPSAYLTPRCRANPFIRHHIHFTITCILSARGGYLEFPYEKGDRAQKRETNPSSKWYN